MKYLNFRVFGAIFLLGFLTACGGRNGPDLSFSDQPIPAAPEELACPAAFVWYQSNKLQMVLTNNADNAVWVGGQWTDAWTAKVSGPVQDCKTKLVFYPEECALVSGERFYQKKGDTHMITYKDQLVCRRGKDIQPVKAFPNTTVEKGGQFEYFVTEVAGDEELEDLPEES